MKARVLLAVPDENLRSRVKALLQGWGFYLIVAKDGADCLSEIETGVPEIVLSSSHLSLVSAKEIYNRLRHDFPFIPFILIGDEANMWDPAPPCWNPEEDEERFKSILFRELKRIRGKVLVMDDDSDFRKTLVEILQNASFEVDQAEDGKGGVALCAREDYDIVLTDIHMPQMNGIEAAKRIHAMRPASFIVCMTGEADEEEIHQALRAARGYYACLRKPFDYHTFLVAVKNLRLDAIAYRKQAKRSLFQKVSDTFKEGIGAAIHRFIEIRSAVTIWVIVIVMAICLGLISSWSVMVLPEYARSFLKQQQESLKKGIQKDVLDREIEKKRKEFRHER